MADLKKELQEEIIKVVEEKDNKPVTTFTETELNEDQKDKKKPSGGYGRRSGGFQLAWEHPGCLSASFRIAGPLRVQFGCSLQAS